MPRNRITNCTVKTIDFTEDHDEHPPILHLSTLSIGYFVNHSLAESAVRNTTN